MLEVIRDEQGELDCVCEWWRVDYSGKRDIDGKIIWVNNIEVSKSCQNNGAIKKIIKQIFGKCSDFEHTYFKRSKYKDRVRIYPRSFWLKLIGENYE